MDLRVYVEPQQGGHYKDLLRITRCAEDAGYEGFFRADHLLPTLPGGGLPGPTEAWTTLAGLARETSRIRLGTLMTAATFRAPALTAITVAQVDQMSGGRIDFGLGSGWFQREHEAFGIPFPNLAERYERFTEQLEIIFGLWNTPVGAAFSFNGKHYQLVDSPALPKPYQCPHPPVVIGGSGPKKSPALVARFADEANLPPEMTAAARQYRRICQACEAIGRDPVGLARSVPLLTCVGRDGRELARRAARIGLSLDASSAAGLIGTPGEIVDRLGQWQREVGIERVYLQILDLADLDHIELIAQQVMPQLS